MTTVILDGLSRNARTNDVEEFFHGFGRIRDINIKAEHAMITFDDRRDADDAVKRLDGRRLCDERVRVMFQNRGDEPPRRDDYRRDDRRDNYRGGGGYNDRGSDRGYNRGYDRGGFNDRRGGYGDRFRDRSPRRDFGGRGRDFGGRPQKRRVERTKFGIICRNLSGRVTWMDLKDLGRKYGDITYSDANRIGDREGLITYATRKDMVNAFESMKGLEFMGRELEVEYEFPETAAEDWDGDANNDHPQSDKNGGQARDNGARDGGRDNGSRGNSPARSRSNSNDRFRDRSRSRSYSR